MKHWEHLNFINDCKLKNAKLQPTHTDGFFHASVFEYQKDFHFSPSHYMCKINHRAEIILRLETGWEVLLSKVIKSWETWGAEIFCQCLGGLFIPSLLLLFLKGSWFPKGVWAAATKYQETTDQAVHIKISVHKFKTMLAN